MQLLAGPVLGGDPIGQLAPASWCGSSIMSNDVVRKSACCLILGSNRVRHSGTEASTAVLISAALSRSSDPASFLNVPASMNPPSSKSVSSPSLPNALNNSPFTR